MESRYVKIEEVILISPILTKEEKLFYTCLKSFRNRETGKCFPSLKTLGERSNLSKRTILKARKRLKSLGVITWDSGRGRTHHSDYYFILVTGSDEEIFRAFVNLKMVHPGTILDENGAYGNHFNAENPENGASGNQKMVHLGTTNHIDITTSSSTKGNITTPPSSSNEIPYQEIVSYLNEKSGKNFKHQTKQTRRLIKARWNEGFRLDDFKSVIDKKCKKWRKDPKMIDYLRPETLFGEKFESYLQERAPGPDYRKFPDYSDLKEAADN